MLTYCLYARHQPIARKRERSPIGFHGNDNLEPASLYEMPAMTLFDEYESIYIKIAHPGHGPVRDIDSEHRIDSRRFDVGQRVQLAGGVACQIGDILAHRLAAELQQRELRNEQRVQIEPHEAHFALRSERQGVQPATRALGKMGIA